MLINPARNPSIFRRRFPIRLWYPSQHLLRQNPPPRSQFVSRRRFPRERRSMAAPLTSIMNSRRFIRTPRRRGRAAQAVRMSLSAAPRQHLVENWQTRQMARPKNYKAQRRTTRRRRLAPRMACKTRHIPAGRLQRNRRRPRAVKIVIAINRGRITLGVRTALIHGSAERFAEVFPRRSGSLLGCSGHS